MSDQEQHFEHITFDKYIYKKIIDLCVDFFHLYGEQVPGQSGLKTSWKLARKFQVILDFSQECETLPEYFRKPPLHKWNMSETPGQIHIHPRLANKFVMKLLNEIKRQQADVKITDKQLEEQLHE